jgi:hypothetical protein
MNNADCLIEILIMIGGKFGHNVSWVAVSDLPACELERPRKLCFEQNSLPGWVSQLQPE